MRTQKTLKMREKTGKQDLMKIGDCSSENIIKRVKYGSHRVGEHICNT